MRYKIGDTVLIKKGLRVGDYESEDFPGTSLYFCKEMKRHCGEKAKVIKVIEEDWLCPEVYFLSITGEQWFWSSEMLVPCNENTVSYYLFEKGKLKC